MYFVNELLYKRNVCHFYILRDNLFKKKLRKSYFTGGEEITKIIIY